MNREGMMYYILAWEGDSEGIEDKLDAMTDSELKKYYEELYDECHGIVPPPDNDIDPSDYLHLTF